MSVLADLLRLAGLPADVKVALTGTEPALPSSFRVGAAAQASIAAAGVGAAAVLRARTGQAATVAVDMRHAAAAFRSERHVRVDGAPPGEAWDALAGAYPTRDGWVRLHTNFPHHRAAALDVLGCATAKDAVASALRGWDAVAFETAVTQAGGCVAALRSFAQWDAHPHAAALPRVPLRLARAGDAPARDFTPDPAAPLAGVRVLDLTRVIAGPVATRTLAAHGADVLAVTSPGRPDMPALLPDTRRGKRHAAIDLRLPAGRARLRALVRQADVFVQSYRPGALAALGFGAEALAALSPGLVVASLSAYGADGPWGGKRGFDSLVQTATGFNAAEADSAGATAPRALPCQALDHASGYLLAAGIMGALLRRAEVGGTWRVDVALATTGAWLRGLGRLEGGFAATDPGQDDIADLLETTGAVTAVRHAAVLQ